MRRIVIAKVGSTMPSLALQKRDFEDWIQAGLQTTDEDTLVVDVRHRPALPSVRCHRGHCDHRVACDGDRAPRLE